MAGFSVIEDFKINKEEKFLMVADQLEPQLISKTMFPKRLVDIEKNETGLCVVKEKNEKLEEQILKKDEKVCIDFGEHMVGYVTLQLSSVGSHQDAPAYLRLKFGEMPQEILDKTEDYQGWISKAWIQEEYVHIDVLPEQLELPRRYAFRYLEIEVIDVSPKFSLKIDQISCRSVSSADMSKLEPVDWHDDMLNQIDRISQLTLKECMQKVFEDGPKRDRRLWLGDLRLQAKANYESFKNYELVKRCLYLFGGLTFNEGKIAACLFTEPTYEPDDTYLMDYALLYVPALFDYFEQTKDRKTLEELYPIAIKQIEICIADLDEKHVVKDLGDAFWCFLDWGDGLNKQAGAQAVLLYCMRYGMKLAQEMKDEKTNLWLEKEMEMCREAAISEFWDEKQNVFVSGKERQISWATQVWMVLAEVFNTEKNKELILHTVDLNPEIRMVTPYMYHHFVDALIQCGEKDRALEEIKKYWGEMINDGADTFWELYNPYNKSESPYGSSIVNSYCHAWSCTPTYLLRRYFMD